MFSYSQSDLSPRRLGSGGVFAFQHRACLYRFSGQNYSPTPDHVTGCKFSPFDDDPLGFLHISKGIIRQRVEQHWRNHIHTFVEDIDSNGERTDLRFLSCQHVGRNLYHDASDVQYHSNCWIHTMVQNICDGVEPQAPPSDDISSRVQWSFFSLFSGSMKSDEPEIQQAITHSTSALDDNNLDAMSVFRYCVKNWRDALKTPAMAHMSNLLGIAIALGFAPTSWTDLHLRSVRLYRITNMDRWTGAVDIFDAIANALNYFVEACYASWHVGNLTPFMYEKTTSRQLDESYEELSDIIYRMETGEYYTKGGNWSDAHAKLTKAKMLYDAAILISPPGTTQRRILADRIATLRSWIFKLGMEQKSSTIREQPFGGIVFGPPGAGKTRLQNGIMHVVAAANGIPFNEEAVADIIPGDAFDSRVTNATMFIRMNDVGNRPLKYDPSLGVAKFIQMCDNVPFTAVKAAVTDKGTVIPSIICVAGSTNSESMDIDKLSVNGDSLRRRICRIDVKVKPQYANELGGRDDHLFAQSPMYRMVNGEQAEAFQLLTINRAVHKGFSPMTMRDPRTKEMRTLENLEIDEYYYFLELVVRAHVSTQKTYVSSSKQFKLVPCNTCHFITCCCQKPLAPLDKSLKPIVEEEMFSDDSDIPSPPSEGSDIDKDYDVAQFLPYEKQGPLVDSCVETVSPFFARFFMNRLGDVPSLFGWLNWGARTKHVRDSVFEVLFQHVDSADFTQWWYWLPDDLWETDLVKKLAPVLQDSQLRKAIINHRRISRCCWIGCGALLWTRNYSAGLFAFGMGFYSSSRLFLMRRSAYDVISHRRHVCQAVAEQHRSKYGPALKHMFMIIAALTTGGFALYGAAELFKDVMSPSSTIETSVTTKEVISEKKDNPAVEEVSDRENCSDEQVSSVQKVKHVAIEQQDFMGMSEEDLKKRNEVRNVWEQKLIASSCAYRNPNMTDVQLRKLVENNLSVLYKKNDKNQYVYHCNVLWLQTDLCVLPAHVVPVVTERWRFQDKSDPRSGKECIVTRDDSVTVKNADFAFVWCPYRSKKNIIPYLNPRPNALQSTFVFKDPTTFDSIAEASKLIGTYVRDRDDQPARVVWEWPIPTFRGLCGGVYVTYGRHPSICGIHYGGTRRTDAKTSDNMLGISFVPSIEDCKKVLSYFHNEKKVLITAEEPDSWNPSINGEDQIIETGYAQKDGISDQVNWLDSQEGYELHLDTSIYESKRDEARGKNNSVDGCCASILVPSEKQAIDVGHRKARAFYKSRVRPTVIADEVSHLYTEREFAPPKFGRSMWSKGAQPAFHTSPGLPSAHLKWAVEDYLSAFQSLSPYLQRDLRPLTWEETLNGIDGKRFIDSMNFSTAAGIGFPGGKKAWLKAYIDDNGNFRRDFVREVHERVNFARWRLSRGKRVPFIFNATPKDEPTDVKKDKVRLFMVGELACVILVRMYFTPVCRVIQMTTKISECAVGINCLSPDWESVMQHLERFDLCFDGDHKKYDTRKSPAVSCASYRIMIEIASLGSYSAEDLFFMSMLASELVRPLTNYNGDVVVLDGSTPSGIPVTVIVNSLDNSLYNRCGYKSIYTRAKVGEFRRYVSHVNYGDDFINSVSWWRRSFNFINVQKYLRTYDLEITPGIKDAKARDFVNRSDLVFLQRKSTRLKGLSYRVGALNESSIFKSLLSVLESTELSPEVAAVTNVDNALREWTFHGKEMYDLRYAQMMTILANKGLLHLSRMHNVSHTESLKKLTS